MQNLSRHTNRGVLHGILDDIGDGVVLTDAQERVLYINDAAISILGCTDIRDELVLFSDICPLVDLDTDVPIGSPIKRAIQSEHSVGLIRDAGIRRSDGTQIYVFTYEILERQDARLLCHITRCHTYTQS